MARIPEDQIERLKSEISIQRLAEAQGIELKPHGKNLIGRCIFHDDKTPSLVITPHTNLWNCLGACRAGGSVIDWVMKVQGISFRHACEILRSGQVPTAPERPVKQSSVRKLPPPVDFSADDRALYKQVVAYYHRTLKSCPEAMAYLASRGITSAETIDRFQLGFANRTLGLRLPHANTKAGGEIREHLQRLGIFRESGHEHFNGSLVIPVADESGEVLEMYGRKITRGLRTGTAEHLYLPGPRRRGVFNIQAVAQYPEIILCESLIDALTFIEAGFPNVTTSYGVSGFTTEHLEAFRRYKTQRVLIAYDRDDAGDTAAAALAPQLMAAGIECFRIQFPHGMDANAYALKLKPAAKSLELVIRKAVWMGKGAAPERAVTEAVASALPAVAAPPETTRVAPIANAAPAAPRPAAARLPVAPAPPVAAPPAIAAAPAPVPASPVPPAPPAVPVEQRGKDLWITLGDREYRIRGLPNVGPLKVDVMVVRGDRFHQDKFDLSLAKQRVAYMHEAAHELGVAEDDIKKDLGVILRTLEGLQEKALAAALEEKTPAVKLTPAEHDAALELLRDPRLVERILEDFHHAGVVGEETNLLVGYLAAVSRKLDHPMAVVIQSSSAAGKSSLMEAVLSFLPAEDQLKYSAMTGQSLFYMGEANLKHKVLAIAEEEGAERASYALKLLQSEGELTIASTGKDPASGRHVTHEYHVEGPVMIFLTTTAVDIDEELLNRCVVLSVNENRDQTRTIHQMQRERQTLEGQLARRDGSRIRARHQNAQRLLRPLIVANPFAPRLTFRDDQTRTRRDHGKYLTLMAAIALLHQYQRPVRSVDHHGEKLDYIEVTRDDIRLTNRLAHEVLGRTLDELPPQTRQVLTRLDAWVGAQCAELQMARADFRFQRRDLRALTGLSETRARDHLDRLVALEYVVVHRGTRGQSFVYELVYDGQGDAGQPFLVGLLDPDALDAAPGYDAKFAGSGAGFAGLEERFAAGSHPHRAPIAPGSPPTPKPRLPAPDPGSSGPGSKSAGNAVLEASLAPASTTRSGRSS
jgi:DNA primase